MKDISKLPKWAQEEFKKLEQERYVAVRELNAWVDNQTPSKIYYDEIICLGEQQGPSFKRIYIQGISVNFDHLGINLRVLLRGDCIDLSWGGENHRKVYFIPWSFQQAHLEP